MSMSELAGWKLPLWQGVEKGPFVIVQQGNFTCTGAAVRGIDEQWYWTEAPGWLLSTSQPVSWFFSFVPLLPEYAPVWEAVRE